MKYLFVVLACALTGCVSNRYYIVRHAEKATVELESAQMMASNPPLSEAGKVRAFVLRDELKDKKIAHIFSTNTIRTMATAQPLSEHTGLPVRTYSSARDSIADFIARLRELEGDVLIVGHSNTVDDLVNRLTGRTDVAGDLPESEYDNIFIVSKRGKKWLFERKKYGYPSNPEK